MYNLTNTLGLLAGSGTTLAFLPQFLKVWRSRSTKDISIMMYFIFCFGLALWIVYGILTHTFPVIIANSVTLVLACSILVMKILWK